MTVEHGTTDRQQLVEPVSIKPSIVVLDPLILRRSCIAHILKEWSKSEGLTINSVAQMSARSRSDLNPDCRLFVISVGGKSVTDPDVRHNIKTAQMLLPEVPLLIVSDIDNRSEVFEAFRLGAKGYIPTSLDPKIALRACTFILGGGSYYPPSALASSGPEDVTVPVEVQAEDQRAEELHPEQSNAAGGATVSWPRILTERQGQVANLLKDGLPNKMIARHLGMTEATVKVHVRQIMRKLGVHNRTQVALSITSVSSGTKSDGLDL
jgi:DNA-binding NarL/FixJ family response regulator